MAEQGEENLHIPPNLANWERMQYKSFRKWCAHLLKQRNITLNDLQKDFDNGVVLVNLLEVLSKKPVAEKLIKKPTMRVQNVNNLGMALKFIKEEKIKTENIGPEDIADQNLKLLLGLVWTLILRYQIQRVADGGSGKPAEHVDDLASLKKALLDRLKKLNSYDGVNITNFTTSWQDGRAFCALVADEDPSLLDYNSLNKDDKLGNLNKAFGILEKDFGVPRLLDAEDLLSDKPDEKSVLTYVSQCIAAFDSDENKNRRRQRTAAADPSQSEISGDGLKKAIVGKPAKFRIQARNAAGANATSGGDPFAVNIAPPPGSAAVIARVQDNRDGTYDVTYVPSTAGPHKIDVTLSGQAVKGSPVTVIAVQPQPDPSKCEISGPGAKSGLVGRDNTFTIHAKDSDGDAIKTGGADFKLDVNGPSGPVPCSVKDNGDGTYTASYKPNAAGEHTIGVTLQGQDIKGSPLKVPVTVPKADPSKCQVSGPGSKGAEVGKETEFTIHAKDSQGNPLTCGGTPFKVGIDGPSGPVQANVHDNGDGTYKVTYKPTEPGSHNVGVTLDGQSVAGCPFKVNATQSADPSKCRVFGPGVQEATTGKPAEFTIEARDTNGNPMKRGGDNFQVQIAGPKGPIGAKVHDNGNGTYNVTYTPLDGGNHKVDVTLSGKPVSGSPFSVNAKQVSDPSKCRASGPGLEKAAVGDVGEFKIEAFDSLGKPLKTGGEPFQVSIATPAGSTPVNAKVQDNGDGTYTVQWSPNASGDHSLAVSVYGHPIAGMPVKVKASQGTDPSKCKVFGPGAERGVTGVPTSFTIQACNSKGDNVKAGGDPFQVRVCPPKEGGAYAAPFPAKVIDNNDGTYTVSWAPKIPGDHYLEVTLTGKAVGKSPYKVPVEAGKPSIMGDFEFAVWQEINKARANPANYALEMAQIKPLYDKKGCFNVPNSTVARQTSEGAQGLEEALRFLNSQKALQPVNINENFSKSCADLVADNGPKGLMGNQMSDGTTASDRLNKYGAWKKKVGEALSYGPYSPQDVVYQWIIDDGMFGKPNRATVFNPEWSVIGVASGPHAKFETMCAVAFASDYVDGGAASGHKETEEDPLARERLFNSEKKKDFLQRIATPDGKGFLVKAGAMNVPADSLKLWKKSQMLVLYKVRPDETGELVKSEFKWDIPYDFDPADVTATYKAGSTEVDIFLLKPETGQTDPNAEAAVMKFTMQAHGSAPRIQVGTADTKDAWILTVHPSQFEENIEVKMKGPTIFFVSKHDITGEDEEGEFTKTITSTCTVNLPFPVAARRFALTKESAQENVVKVTKPATSKGDVEIPIH